MITVLRKSASACSVNYSAHYDKDTFRSNTVLLWLISLKRHTGTSNNLLKPGNDVSTKYGWSHQEQSLNQSSPNMEPTLHHTVISSLAKQSRNKCVPVSRIRVCWRKPFSVRPGEPPPSPNPCLKQPLHYPVSPQHPGSSVCPIRSRGSFREASKMSFS